MGQITQQSTFCCKTNFPFLDIPGVVAMVDGTKVETRVPSTIWNRTVTTTVGQKMSTGIWFWSGTPLGKLWMLQSTYQETSMILGLHGGARYTNILKPCLSRTSV